MERLFWTLQIHQEASWGPYSCKYDVPFPKKWDADFDTLIVSNYVFYMNSVLETFYCSFDIIIFIQFHFLI